MTSHNLPTQHGLFDIQNIEIVFRHPFDGANGQDRSLLTESSV